jgi:glycosyltransferase involved in cell wall biosynthesis
LRGRPRRSRLRSARQYPRWLYPGQGDIDPAASQRLDVATASFAVLEPWSWGRALRALDASAPDAVVLPYWTWAWAPFQLAMLRGRTPPAVAIVHNPADHDAGWLARWAARAVLGSCRALFCHAAAVRDQLASQFPCAPTVVHPLPCADPVQVDRGAARIELGLVEQDVAVLCFGLIRPYKGTDVVLDAFARLSAGSPLKLLLAGEPWGELGAHLAARVRSPKLVDRVKARLHWIPESEAPRWFAAADLAVLPYRSATGSAVAAQALAYGLPIVGSAVGGIAEVVESGVNGLLVPPGDAGALEAALLAAAEPAARARLAAGARASAQRWSWDSYAAALEELVARVIPR